MSYVKPSDLITTMIDAGESKVFMSARDTLVRAAMAGALLSLTAAFAVTVSVTTGIPLAGAILFPVGFILLYLLGYDLLTGVFVLTPLALLDRRPGVTVRGVLRNWALVFVGNFIGAFMVALLMAVVVTYGFAVPPNEVGVAIGHIGEGRTLGYAEHGASGMLTLFVRGMLCNWMVSIGVAGAMIAKDVLPHGHRTSDRRLSGLVSLDVLKSTNTHALLRGAVPKGAHTSSDSGLARYLEDRFVADKGIHLDLTVSIDT